MGLGYFDIVVRKLCTVEMLELFDLEDTCKLFHFFFLPEKLLS